MTCKAVLSDVATIEISQDQMDEPLQIEMSETASRTSLYQACHLIALSQPHICGELWAYNSLLFELISFCINYSRTLSSLFMGPDVAYNLEGSIQRID